MLRRGEDEDSGVGRCGLSGVVQRPVMEFDLGVDSDSGCLGVFLGGLVPQIGFGRCGGSEGRELMSSRGGSEGRVWMVRRVTSLLMDPCMRSLHEGVEACAVEATRGEARLAAAQRTTAPNSTL